MYSALKHRGERLYVLARRGVEVERPARPVAIHDLRLLALDGSRLEFEVYCGKGTYVRTLGEDIARALGTVGHLTGLRRTRFGPFDGRPLVALATLETLASQGQEPVLDAMLLPCDAALGGYPAVTVAADEALRFRHGQGIPAVAPAGARLRIYGPDGTLLGLGQASADGHGISPVRLLTEAA